jgi:NAD(P)H-hydrate epimerase
MVRLSSPGLQHDPLAPTEVVGRALPPSGWASEVLEGLDRFHCLVIGPGLGRDDSTALSVRNTVTRAPVPVVVDGDGLFALAWSGDGAAHLLRQRHAPTVLTPHDGEYAILTGARIGPDRIGAARSLARATNCVVVLKGPGTVVAEPGGRTHVVTAGDSRLATAGTGDVLAGIIGGLLANGVPAFEAASAGVWVHGQAGRHGPERGLVASDLLGAIPDVLSRL